jgi:hypothetical protein
VLRLSSSTLQPQPHHLAIHTRLRHRPRFDLSGRCWERQRLCEPLLRQLRSAAGQLHSGGLVECGGYDYHSSHVGRGE